MKATIDSAGRLLVPKPLRQALGLLPGVDVDVSVYGDGIYVAPGGRTASLRPDETGALVVDSDVEITDAMVFSLMDAGRK